MTMTSNEIRRYTMFVRVRDFAEAQRDTLVRSTTALTHLDALKGAIARLDAEAVKKLSSARQGRANRLARRAALTARLVDIARTARDVAHDAPAMRDDFPLRRFAGDQALINLGRVFVEKAAPSATAFVDNGLPETFITELNAAISDLDQAVQQTEQEKRRHANARDNIRDAFRVADVAVRRLHRVMTNQLRNNPLALADWERARHLGQPARRRPRAVPSAEAQTAQAPAVHGPGL